MDGRPPEDLVQVRREKALENWLRPGGLLALLLLAARYDFPRDNPLTRMERRRTQALKICRNSSESLRILSE